MKKPKHDVEFLITKVPSSYRQKCCRYSIINGVFPHMKHPEQDLHELYALIFKRWRRVLARLHHVGRTGQGCWHKVDDGKDYQYMRNCPPCGVVTEHATHCCQQSLICPWCWARNYVLKPYTLIENLLFRPYDSVPLLDCKIVVARRRSYDWHEFMLSEEEQRGHNLQSAFETMFIGALERIEASVKNTARRMREVRSCAELHGAYVLHRVNVNRWRHPFVDRSSVLLVDAHEKVRFEGPPRVYCKEWPATRVGLLRAVKSAGLFPRGLWRLSPDLLGILLNRMSRVHMYATYGVLRGDVQAHTRYKESLDEQAKKRAMLDQQRREQRRGRQS